MLAWFDPYPPHPRIWQFSVGSISVYIAIIKSIVFNVEQLTGHYVTMIDTVV